MRSWKVEGGGLKCTTSVMISSHLRYFHYLLFLTCINGSIRLLCCFMFCQVLDVRWIDRFNIAMTFLPLQALFGEEAALRSPAPAVNDIVTCFHIHHFRFFAAAQTVSLDGFASLCSTVGERGIPTRTSEVTRKK